MRNLSALIMAAGKGTRMVSSRAKVLHSLCGIPMIRLVYRAVAPLEPEDVFVIIGYDAENVRNSLEGLPVRFVLQKEQLGTGHAVMSAREELETKRSGDLLALFGDTPRVKTETLRKLVEHHRLSGASTTLLTVHAPDPYGYGRILRGSDDRIDAIVEEKDASPEQRRITEINPGFYCFRVAPLLESLGRLSNQNAQGEYYVTDLIEIQRRAGMIVDAVLHEDYEELRGINSREQLSELSAALARENNRKLMAGGVTLIDPENTYIHLDVAMESDVTVHPMVTIEGNSHIGEGCVLRPGSRITNSVIDARVEVLDCCVIADSRIGAGSVVGPSAHVRDHSDVGERCRIGSYVEVVRSRLGNDTKALHLAYLGDAQIGSRVNIGAGVVTCNYDGIRKNATIIEDDVFIGSDSQLVAPVVIRCGSYVAAGSTITRNVPKEALGISRARQLIRRDWTKRRLRSDKAHD